MVFVNDKAQTGSVNPLHSSGKKRKRRLSRLLRRILPALLILSLWAPASFAADIVVTTAEDRLDAAFATFDVTFDAFAGIATGVCGTVVDPAAFPAEPSLREALIYANHTPGPDTITFAPDLSGQTIMISFDGPDEGDQADPLPWLCGGDITLSGDVDEDGMSDITLDGSMFPPDDIFGATWGLVIESDNNAITGFTLRHFPYIGIAAGSGWSMDTVTGNRIANNTVDGGGIFGIAVSAGSTVKAGTTQDTTISGNTVSGITSFGIYVTISSGSSLTNTTIQQNTVFENGFHGIAAWPYAGSDGNLTNLRLLDNHVYANGALGIGVGGGTCGATGNMVEAEIARNTLSGNLVGISTWGGANEGCIGEFEPASQNHLTVAIADNVSEDERGNGINILGGPIDGNNNTVDATVTGNTVLRSGANGILVDGGFANHLDANGMEVTTAMANGNTVTAMLANNRVEGAMWQGLAFVAGNAGAVSNNMVEVEAQNNIVCGSGGRADIWGQGGVTNDENSFWANAGTGNALTVTLTDNSAGSVSVEDGVAGNTAMLTESGTQPCGQALENPQPDSSQSGIGVISGWVCEAEEITVEFEHGETGAVSSTTAGYGTSRADTMDTCGDDNNGFSLLFNWNLLGDGMHTVRTLADGVEFGRSSVMVSSLGLGEFVTGLSGMYPLADFPLMGTTTTIQWEQSLQNFVIATGAGGGGGSAGAAPQVLENPQPGSFQSGIGVISGWVCEAEEITIEFQNGVTGEVSSTTAGSGTSRADTMAACGDDNNGFSLLFNWNLLGDGLHTVRALADGEEFANVTVTVSSLSGEFMTGMSGAFPLPDFPSAGQETTVEWEESLQNFVITGVEPSAAE